MKNSVMALIIVFGSVSLSAHAGPELRHNVDLRTLYSQKAIITGYTQTLEDGSRRDVIRTVMLHRIWKGGNRELAVLKEFPLIYTISLRWNNNITDETLQILTDNKIRARRLFLHRVAATDKGIKDLEEWDSLEVLHISGSQFTDAIIPSLKKLTNLKTLKLYGANLTPDAIDRLRESLKSCNITTLSDLPKKSQ